MTFPSDRKRDAEILAPEGLAGPIVAGLVDWADTCEYDERLLILNQAAAVLDWIKRNQADHPQREGIQLVLDTTIRTLQDLVSGMEAPPLDDPN